MHSHHPVSDQNVKDNLRVDFGTENFTLICFIGYIFNSLHRIAWFRQLHHIPLSLLHHDKAIRSMTSNREDVEDDEVRIKSVFSVGRKKARWKLQLRHVLSALTWCVGVCTAQHTRKRTKERRYSFDYFQQFELRFTWVSSGSKHFWRRSNQTLFFTCKPTRLPSYPECHSLIWANKFSMENSGRFSCFKTFLPFFSTFWTWGFNVIPNYLGGKNDLRIVVTSKLENSADISTLEYLKLLLSWIESSSFVEVGDGRAKIAFRKNIIPI